MVCQGLGRWGVKDSSPCLQKPMVQWWQETTRNNQSTVHHVRRAMMAWPGVGISAPELPGVAGENPKPDQLVRLQEGLPPAEKLKTTILTSFSTVLPCFP